MANLQLIKTLAEKQGIPITELAQRIGVSENQVHLMCRKNSTKIETLEKIANILKVPVSYFFDEPQETSRDTYDSHGDRNVYGKYVKIDSLDQRTMTDLKEEVEEKEVKVIGKETIEEKIIFPTDCPDEARHIIEKLSLKVEMLTDKVKDYKERITELKERINELKASMK